MSIPVLRPSYTEAEEAAVAAVLRSGWSGLGPKVEEFEQAFAKHLGVKHAVATSSCTAALQLALKIVGVDVGGYVLVPSLTFVSTAHVVRYLNAHPVFMDTDPATLCSLDDQINEAMHRRRYGSIDAVVTVLYAGQPVSLKPIDFPVVYDCAHACGSTFNAKGKLCAWSFHAVKNLSCGEGGMLTTDDTQLAERARRLRWMGISTSTYERNYATQTRPAYKWEYDCQEIGYKANMHDISAAIGLVQLQRLKEMQTRREQLAACYRIGLMKLEIDRTIEVFRHVDGSSYHLFMIRCDNRDALHRYLAERGIGTGVHYKPIHLYPCYGYQPSLPVVEREWLRLLTLPLYPDLTLDQVEMICGHVRDFYAGSAHYAEGS